jgi:hypothetical protein
MEKYADRREKSRYPEKAAFLNKITVHFRFSGFLMIERKTIVPGFS